MRSSLKKALAASLEGGLRRVYDRFPAAARAAVPRTARDFVRERFTSRTLAAAYDDKLWQGFSTQARADLERLKADAGRPLRERTEACYSLARWHAVEGDFAVALEEMRDRLALDPRLWRTGRQYMLEALFLCRLGRTEEARALIGRAGAGLSFDIALQLMKANCHNPAVSGSEDGQAGAATLECINAIYRRFRLPEIARRDEDAPLTLDNIRTEGVRTHFDADNKVTVIVPAYNCADTILTALASLAEQSWRNLEVLVVDDCSTDDTATTVAAFCAADDRFRLIRQARNGGSYACRNRALEEASGRFVTVHDADDWAHPLRIGMQVRALLRSSGPPYNLSRMARATPSLAFFGTWRPSESLTALNLSSLMIERPAFAKAGNWHEVRVSADQEFVRRLDVIFGADHRKQVVSDCPLAFARTVPTSLTRHGNTHVRTFHHGIRRTYHEVVGAWHMSLAERKAEAPAGVPQSLPVPLAIRSGHAAGERLDVVFIGDFNMSGGTYHSAMAMLRAANAAGLSTGLLHHRRYDLDVAAPLRRQVIDHAAENGVRIVSAGESVDARTVVVTHPPILHHRLDMFPRIAHERLVVVVNQMAERDRSGKDMAYDPATVRRHLVEYFGHEGDWVPISGTVRTLMMADGRYPPPHGDTWTPLVDTGEWCAREPRWRGRERGRPVAGRHGRDHVLKWLGARRDLLDAYCAGRACEVRFLGGAAHARTIAGRWPANWTAGEFGTRDVREFLSDLDFFLHYPHDDYIEEFGRAPMEAMAVGVPVILPPVFRATFGDAALYAEPRDVWAAMDRLWADEKAWMERIEAGRAFVMSNCSLDLFPARLRPEGNAPGRQAHVQGEGR